MSIFSTFIKLNHAISFNIIEPIFRPFGLTDIFQDYPQVIKKILDTGKPKIILDVGGGSNCEYAKFRRSNHIIIAIDNNKETLSKNNDIEIKCVADICKPLPFADQSVDLITSSSVLEHLEDVELFIRNADVTLKSRGYMVHRVPNKFSPFSLINRLLPNRVTKNFLEIIWPGSSGNVGYRAYYNYCYPNAFSKLLKKHNFDIVEIKVGYVQAGYYSFLFPFYFLGKIYDLLVSFLNVKNLCANFLVIAHKPAENALTTESNSSK